MEAFDDDKNWKPTDTPGVDEFVSPGGDEFAYRFRVAYDFNGNGDVIQTTTWTNGRSERRTFPSK